MRSYLQCVVITLWCSVQIREGNGEIILLGVRVLMCFKSDVRVVGLRWKPWI